jgi:EAL domain-containing protein (putative c-di-GMP-specific phosphodiesterase class I)/GGDEF domain-containing protein
MLDEDETLSRNSARITALEEKVRELEVERDTLLREAEELRTAVSKLERRGSLLEQRLILNSVTGLPTHYKMRQDIKAMIDLASSPDSESIEAFGLAILQADGALGMIRKSLKSSVGEWILYQCGIRIKEALAPGERLYHARDGEFIMALKRGVDEEAYEALCQDIVARFSKPHIFSGFNLSLGANMGIALFPRDGRHRGALLHNADIALGVALERKRPVAFYRPEFHLQVIEKMELQNSIIKAIEAPAVAEIGKQFEINYQPKLVIEGLSDAGFKIASISAEALIRWQHPKRGSISPERFIPLAEETGLILPLGKWIQYQVLHALRRFRSAGLEVGVSVNISSRQFRSGEGLEVFSRLNSVDDGLLKMITVELTETSIFDNFDEALDVARRFKELGIRFSLDDFGTGYSSLSHLQKFPLDEIKIDKSFVSDFPESNNQAAIVESLAGMAKRLRLHVVAEGVERAEQIEGLLACGCSGFQGFYFSEPLSEKGFAAYAKRLKDEGMLIPYRPSARSAPR